jgi:hypothetical protein
MVTFNPENKTTSLKKPLRFISRLQKREASILSYQTFFQRGLHESAQNSKE